MPGKFRFFHIPSIWTVIHPYPHSLVISSSIPSIIINILHHQYQSLSSPYALLNHLNLGTQGHPSLIHPGEVGLQQFVEGLQVDDDPLGVVAKQQLDPPSELLPHAGHQLRREIFQLLHPLQRLHQGQALLKVLQSSPVILQFQTTFLQLVSEGKLGRQFELWLQLQGLFEVGPGLGVPAFLELQIAQVASGAVGETVLVSTGGVSDLVEGVEEVLPGEEEGVRPQVDDPHGVVDLVEGRRVVAPQGVQDLCGFLQLSQSLHLISDDGTLLYLFSRALLPPSRDAVPILILILTEDVREVVMCLCALIALVAMGLIVMVDGLSQTELRTFFILLFVVHVGEGHVLVGEDDAFGALYLLEEGDLGLELLDGLGVQGGLLWPGVRTALGRRGIEGVRDGGFLRGMGGGVAARLTISRVILGWFENLLLLLLNNARNRGKL